MNPVSFTMKKPPTGGRSAPIVTGHRGFVAQSVIEPKCAVTGKTCKPLLFFKGNQAMVKVCRPGGKGASVFKVSSPRELTEKTKRACSAGAAFAGFGHDTHGGVPAACSARSPFAKCVKFVRAAFPKTQADHIIRRMERGESYREAVYGKRAIALAGLRQRGGKCHVTRTKGKLKRACGGGVP